MNIRIFLVSHQGDATAKHIHWTITKPTDYINSYYTFTKQKVPILNISTLIKHLLNKKYQFFKSVTI